MHFINTRTLQLSTFPSEEGLGYAILSHRWLQPPLEEVLFQDMLDLERCSKYAGVHKLTAFCELAAEQGFEWCWMDTCCIDKTSSAELSEAINSMYRWYRSADVCIAYLADVHERDDLETLEAELTKSDWFTRCWTLQELIAPLSHQLRFYNAGWRRLASKHELSRLLSEVTGVDKEALEGAPLSNYSLAERMAWAAHREATRAEDQAYSLMGLFDVNMPMLYGEGGTRAFERLCETIIQYTNDETIFAWSAQDDFRYLASGLLAPSPYYYRDCQGVKPMNLFARDDVFTLTSRGLTSTLMTAQESQYVRLAFLNAAFLSSDSEAYIAVYLERVGNDPDQYVRKLSNRASRAIYSVSRHYLSNLDLKPTKVYVRHRGHQKIHITSLIYGVDLSELLPPPFPNADPCAKSTADSSKHKPKPLLDVAPDCSLSGPPTCIYRPNEDPQGPLCNIAFEGGYNGIVVVQLGVVGDFFTSSPVLILHDEVLSAPENRGSKSSKDIRDFKLDYSKTKWSMVQQSDQLESNGGVFEFKMKGDNCFVRCMGEKKPTFGVESLLGQRTKRKNYNFSIKAEILPQRSNMVTWKIRIL